MTEAVNSNVLIFDTETTGLKKDKLPCTHEKQPMPIQIGLKLDGENRHERLAMNFMMRPEDRWHMEAKASEITGLNNGLADEYGIHFITGIETFLDCVDNAGILVAHNAAFDITVMRRAVYVYSQMMGIPYEDPFEDKTLICTMLASLNLVKAKPKRNGQWKWPRLEECIRFFFNEELDGAHDALIDVRACARVYYELIDEGVLA
ncbi:DNA polymerase III alpha subunit [Ruegeria phage RpAliso]|nr:DNA polymerase III alpha subunit [Ruegeria phage RpAliso]